MAKKENTRQFLRRSAEQRSWEEEKKNENLKKGEIISHITADAVSPDCVIYKSYVWADRKQTRKGMEKDSEGDMWWNEWVEKQAIVFYH